MSRRQKDLKCFSPSRLFDPPLGDEAKLFDIVKFKRDMMLRESTKVFSEPSWLKDLNDEFSAAVKHHCNISAQDPAISDFVQDRMKENLEILYALGIEKQHQLTQSAEAGAAEENTKKLLIDYYQKAGWQIF